MKKRSVKYNYGECEICDGRLAEKQIKQDFWIRGQLVVIDNVPAGVCLQCGAKVVRSEIGKRIAATLGNPKKWSKGSTLRVPVVALHP